MSKQKKTTPKSNGTCNLCGATFSKDIITKHLELCRQEKAQAASGKQQIKKSKIFHIMVEGRYQPEYWLHIAVPFLAKLRDIDGFLRETWVECCGHLSAFTIGSRTYSSDSSGGFNYGDFFDVDGDDENRDDEETGEEGMDVKVGYVLHPKLKFNYEYDFGTTTELTLTVVSEYEDKVKGNSILLLAQNELPLIACSSCKKVATHVCAECIYDGTGWLCDGCAEKHECGEEMLLPVVNSPRVGMCGYTG